MEKPVSEGPVPVPEGAVIAKQFSSHFGQIGDVTTGVNKISRKNPNENNIEMFHMTSWKNLQSIMKVGLDPSRGGKPGGSCGITIKDTLRKESEETTEGRIAAASSNEVTAPYIHQRVAWADLVIGTPSANYEVLLKFDCRLGRPWVEDPVHHGAWHTKQLIKPEAVACLLADGWYPILKIDQEVLASLAEYPDAKTVRPQHGLAFTFEEFKSLVFGMEHLSAEDPKALWEKLKAMKGSQYYLKPDFIECVFAGTNGHPIKEPDKWLYVCHLPRGVKTVPYMYKEMNELYKEKILLPGWGKD